MSTRRDFLAGAGKVLIAGLALPVIQSCVPTSAPIATTTSGTNPIGPDGKITVDVADIDATHFKVVPGVTGPDGFGVAVTKDETGAYNALSMRCTHAGCSVDSRLANNHIHCACHGSEFDLDGVVLTPPATQSLKKYGTTYDAGSKLLTVKIV
jgi:cytochrome b6-f complex iron-sulfur subunit